VFGQNKALLTAYYESFLINNRYNRIGMFHTCDPMFLLSMPRTRLDQQTISVHPIIDVEEIQLHCSNYFKNFTDCQNIINSLLRPPHY